MFFTLHFLLFITLLLTRFVGLDWGAPYAMHPDEWNIARSLQQLTCALPSSAFDFQLWQECLNPHFYAYGQVTIYLGRLLVEMSRLYTGVIGDVQLSEAILALRALSAAASTAAVLLGVQIARAFSNSAKQHEKARSMKWLPQVVFISLIFSPALIQSAHFGTTESMLLLTYTSLCYTCILFVKKSISFLCYGVSAGLLVGFGAAVKVSSLVFALPCALIMVWWFARQAHAKNKSESLQALTRSFLQVVVIAIFSATGLFVLLSPHNVIHFADFTGSLDYESAVALGQLRVFYTQAFDGVGVWFPFTHIFPFALGSVVWLLAVGGFLLLSWRNKSINVLRVFLAIYIFTAGLTHTQWTRFYAPVFPLLIIMASITICTIWNKFASHKSQTLSLLVLRATCLVLFIFMILPGLAYMYIYTQEDVRFTASSWMHQNIPPRSHVLSETANVINLPISPPDAAPQHVYFEVVPFDFYHVDEDEIIAMALRGEIASADYIVVPSRRLFANYTCERPDAPLPKQAYNSDHCKKLRTQYPILNNYYRTLFDGSLGYAQVTRFERYPTITLFGTTVLSIPDEYAEETMSVFDHPVIRIYKRT